MDIGSISHNFIVLVICLPKLSNLVKIFRSSDKNKLDIFGPPHVLYVYCRATLNIANFTFYHIYI